MSLLPLAASGLAIVEHRATAGRKRHAGAVAPIQRASGVTATDSIVTGWVEDERIPGAVLLVARGDRVLIEKAYGWAQLYEYGTGQYGNAATASDPAAAATAAGEVAAGEVAAREVAEQSTGEARAAAIRRLDDPRPMTVDTAFDLASVTKVMATTFAVMLLVDAGELELDAPVRTYLPDFTGGGKERVTLRHLLTHRSGLAQWKPVYYSALDAEQAHRYIRDLPLAWGVDEGRHYSDLGFMVLGLVVERVAGTPLDAFLHERLYGPLGLTATGFRPPTGTAGTASRPPGTSAPRPTGAAASRPSPSAGLRRGGPFAATSHGNPFEHRMVHDPDFGYRYEGDPHAWDGWREYTLVGEANDGNAFHAFGGVAGHAGLFSTAGDLHVLLRTLLDRGRYGGRRYLSSDVVERFLEPHGDGQALGWQVLEIGPAGSFFHPGFTGTYVLFVPERDLAVVLLTNRQNVGVDEQGRYPDLDELQRGVVRAVVRP